MRYFTQAIAGSFVLAVLFLVPVFASAASLFIVPESDSYAVGKSFSVRVRVSSPVAINALSGTLTFPTDKLQVTSVSKAGSILTLWVADPSFNNNTGQVTFEGVVPNPGFIGSNGLVLVVTFRVVDMGSATVSLTNASVLANDGSGTNVLNSLIPGVYRLTEEVVAPPEEVVEVTSPPVEVVVTPPTPVVEETKRAGWFVAAREIVLTGIAVLSPLLLMFTLIYIVVTRRSKRAHAVNHRFKSDVEDLERLVEKAFSLLQEDVTDSVKLLEQTRTRRKLTSEEEAIMDRLRENLEEAEGIIQGKVKKIEKEIQ